MTLVIRLKKGRWLGRKEIIVVVFAVILTTGAIKASDSFLNDRTTGTAGNGELCPNDMVFVAASGGGFCIDKYEDSAGPDCPNQVPQSQNETRLNLDNTACIPISGVSRPPWRNISQDQAAAACAKAGKRLPTGPEWLQAAYGTPDLDENWGSEDCQVNSNWENQPGLTGTGRNCVSAAGAADMIGNVWEWTEGTVSNGRIGEKELPASGFITGTDGESFPATTDVNIPDPNYSNDYFWLKDNGLRAIARGGYWRNQADAGKYSLYIAIPPSQAEVGIGFRCVR